MVQHATTMDNPNLFRFKACNSNTPDLHRIFTSNHGFSPTAGLSQHTKKMSKNDKSVQNPWWLMIYVGFSTLLKCQKSPLFHRLAVGTKGKTSHGRTSSDTHNRVLKRRNITCSLPFHWYSRLFKCSRLEISTLKPWSWHLKVHTAVSEPRRFARRVFGKCIVESGDFGLECGRETATIEGINGSICTKVMT